MARLPLCDFRTVWRPYELTPSSGLGRTKSKRDAYLSFMGDPMRVQAYFARLRSEAAETGIAFEFDGHTSATFDAHRLAEWALETHGDDAQDRLMTQQFAQYFEAGQPPNSIDAQVAAAAAAGLDADAARAVFADKRAYADATRAKLDSARRAGVSGVPAFRIGGVEIATGAQSAEFWEHQLRVAAASLGAPLLGDLKYGSEAALEDRSIGLHAHCLELPHPTRDETLRFRVPAPRRPWWSFAACDLARTRGACTETV